MSKVVDGNSYERYLRDMKQYDSLSGDRERDLSLILKKGSRKAKRDAVNELATGNLHLVMNCLMDFSHYLTAQPVSITIMDLVAEGNLALVEAASKFDPAYGTDSGRRPERPDRKNRAENRARFRTAQTKENAADPSKFRPYARECIKNRMRRALKLSRLIHVPEFHFGCWSKIRRMETENGGPMSDAAIRQKLGISRDRLERIKESRETAVTKLEDMFGEEDSRDWAEVIADGNSPLPSEVVERRDLREFLMEQMDLLPERTRKMLDAMFFAPRKVTLEDLSEQFGVSRERCRQVCAHGLKSLRRLIEAKLGADGAQETLTARCAAA